MDACLVLRHPTEKRILKATSTSTQTVGSHCPLTDYNDRRRVSSDVDAAYVAESIIIPSRLLCFRSLNYSYS